MCHLKINYIHQHQSIGVKHEPWNWCVYVWSRLDDLEPDHLRLTGQVVSSQIVRVCRALQLFHVEYSLLRMCPML